MRIAVVAAEYPDARFPEKAMFVRDQVDALRAAGHEVTVVHHDPPTLRRLASRMRARAAASPSPVSTDATADATTAPGRGAAAPRPAARAAVLARLRQLGRVVHDGSGQLVAEALMLRDLARLDPAPDVVHAHNALPAGCAAARFAATAGVPFVVTEHSSAFLRGQLTAVEVRRAARAYRAASAVVAVSPVQAQALPATGVHVVPNVVPAEFTLRSPEAASSGDIVSIGTLMPHKGMHTLIEAYAALPQSVRATHRLVIVGGGPEAGRLATLAREAGVADRVELTGPLPRPEVAQRLRRAVLLVSASPVETFGVTLLEGLAAGVPFVAVRSGGPQSIWFDGAGVLVDAPQASLLAAGIGEALHPTHDDAFRRAEVLRRFGPEQVACELSDLYRAARSAAVDHTRR